MSNSEKKTEKDEKEERSLILRRMDEMQATIDNIRYTIQNSSDSIRKIITDLAPLYPIYKEIVPYLKDAWDYIQRSWPDFAVHVTNAVLFLKHRRPSNRVLFLSSLFVATSYGYPYFMRSQLISPDLPWFRINTPLSLFYPESDRYNRCRGCSTEGEFNKYKKQKCIVAIKWDDFEDVQCGHHLYLLSCDNCNTVNIHVHKWDENDYDHENDQDMVPTETPVANPGLPSSSCWLSKKPHYQPLTVYSIIDRHQCSCKPDTGSDSLSSPPWPPVPSSYWDRLYLWTFLPRTPHRLLASVHTVLEPSFLPFPFFQCSERIRVIQCMKCSRVKVQYSRYPVPRVTPTSQLRITP